MSSRPDLRVEFYAGASADESPRAVWEGSVRLLVEEVLERGREPKREFFAVRLADGRVFRIESRAGGGGWSVRPARPEPPG